jgi:threonyl-tRNA synthetase
MNQNEVVIKFPNGIEKKYVKGIALEEIAQSISSSLKKKSVAGLVNGSLYDFRRSINENANIELYDLNSSAGIEIMRHTTAHVLAQAIKRLYGDVVQLGIGPVIENGFYYDLDLENNLTVNDLAKIEKEMNKIISENLEIKREEISRDKAKEIFANDPLKLELLEDFH